MIVYTFSGSRFFCLLKVKTVRQFTGRYLIRMFDLGRNCRNDLRVVNDCFFFSHSIPSHYLILRPDVPNKLIRLHFLVFYKTGT